MANAGIAHRVPIAELTDEKWDETQEVNLKGVLRVTRAAVPAMRRRRAGSIVAVSSISGLLGWSEHAQYNASKAGMEGLTRGYAARLATEGVTVNAVAPTLIETEDMPAARVAAGASIPLGRLGRGEEVAQATLMVIANAYMTGQTVQLNGGMYFI